MNNNLYFYEKFRTPPKEALSSFSNGTFEGIDINSMWRIKCLTEAFGACGHGWNTTIDRTWTESGADGEVLAFVQITLRVVIDGIFSEPIQAIGGSKLIQYVKSRSALKSNDEAFKMAYTDAIGAACKMLGVGADIYWNKDKTKYSAETNNDEPKSGSNPCEIVSPKEILTVEELRGKYGIQNAESVAAYLEEYHGVPLKDFNERQRFAARRWLDKKYLNSAPSSVREPLEDDD